MPNGKGRLFGRFENRDFGISEMDHFSRKAVARRCSAKMMLLEIPQIYRKAPMPESHWSQSLRVIIG